MSDFLTPHDFGGHTHHSPGGHGESRADSSTGESLAEATTEKLVEPHDESEPGGTGSIMQWAIIFLFGAGGVLFARNHFDTQNSSSIAIFFEAFALQTIVWIFLTWLVETYLDYWRAKSPNVRFRDWLKWGTMIGVAVYFGTAGDLAPYVWRPASVKAYATYEQVFGVGFVELLILFTLTWLIFYPLSVLIRARRKRLSEG